MKETLSLLWVMLAGSVGGAIGSFLAHSWNLSQDRGLVVVLLSSVACSLTVVVILLIREHRRLIAR